MNWAVRGDEIAARQEGRSALRGSCGGREGFGVPVTQDQFRSTVTVLAVAEVVVEVAVASKDHEITFEIRGCSFSEH